MPLSAVALCKTKKGGVRGDFVVKPDGRARVARGRGGGAKDIGKFRSRLSWGAFWGKVYPLKARRSFWGEGPVCFSS